MEVIVETKKTTLQLNRRVEKPKTGNKRLNTIPLYFMEFRWPKARKDRWAGKRREHLRSFRRREMFLSPFPLL